MEVDAGLQRSQREARQGARRRQEVEVPLPDAHRVRPTPSRSSSRRRAGTTSSARSTPAVMQMDVKVRRDGGGCAQAAASSDSYTLPCACRTQRIASRGGPGSLGQGKDFVAATWRDAREERHEAEDGDFRSGDRGFAGGGGAARRWPARTLTARRRRSSSSARTAASTGSIHAAVKAVDKGSNSVIKIRPGTYKEGIALSATATTGSASLAPAATRATRSSRGITPSSTEPTSMAQNGIDATNVNGLVLEEPLGAQLPVQRLLRPLRQRRPPTATAT